MQVAPTIVQAEDVPDINLDGADERFLRALRIHAGWLDRNMDTPISDLILDQEASPHDDLSAVGPPD